MATGRVPTTANSPLTAKGDLFTYSTAPARLAVGNSGEQIVADSSTSTGLRYTAGTVIANPILNSAMQIWQRGTSISQTASTVPYTADRWQAYNGANQANTISRQATNDTTNLPNIQYCARFQRNSGQTGLTDTGLYQAFETLNTVPFVGKTITISYYARAGANFSATSNQFSSRLYMGTGTDQNLLTSGYTGLSILATGTVTLTTTWQRFTYTASIPTSATEITVGFYYTPVGTASTNDYFEMTGAQIDIGSVALPFRTNGGTIQGEYSACRRYYHRNSANSTNQYSVVAQGSATNTTNGAMMVPFDVPMRIAPTVVDYSTLRLADGVGAWTITAVSIDTNLVSADYGFINATVASGLTQYRPLFIQCNASASAYLGFSAEL